MRQLFLAGLVSMVVSGCVSNKSADEPSARIRDTTLTAQDTTTPNDAQARRGTDSTRTLRDTASVRAALLRLEDEWATAHASRDPTPLGRLLGDEYVGVTATGDFWPKAKEIAMTRAGSAADPAASNPAQALDSVQVKLYGDVALMTARITEKAKRTSDADLHYYYTSAYVWRDGRWQAVMGHVSPAAKP